MKAGTVKGACNKHYQNGGKCGRVSDRGRREVETYKQMGNKVSTCFCSLFVPVV